MNNNAQDADRSNTTPFNLVGHFIKDLSFENPDPISLLSATEQNAPQMGLDVSVVANALNEDHFEVVLNTKLSAKQDEKVAFLIEIAFSTIVQIDKDVLASNQTESVLLVDVPHNAFPFLRAIIYNLMRDGGLPPFNLAPINFDALYQQNKKNVH